MASYEAGYDPNLGYNKHAFENPPPQLVVLGKTVRLIAAPIGLVSEVIHNRMDKKRAKAASSSAAEETKSPMSDVATQSPRSDAETGTASIDATYVNLPSEEADALIASGQALPADDQEATHELVPTGSNEEDVDQDEVDWALDDATGEMEEKTNLATLEKIGYGKSVADSRPPAFTSSQLPFPVVIPQQRPGTKVRGFVRAYAPVLQDSGIGRDQFLTFLKDLHTNAQASPIFNVIKLGTTIAGAFPEPSVFVAAAAIQLAADIGREINERWRTNKFLDQANKELFMARGLYALIVTYRPIGANELKIDSENIDLGANALAKYGASHGIEAVEASQENKTKIDELKIKVQRLRVASGKSTDSQMPMMCAPLIFPALDAAQDASESKKGAAQGQMIDEVKSSARGSAKFVDDYFDRRAQAKFAAAHPNSTLTKQVSPVAPQFKSKYADPNNHTNKHFFTLITGGKYKAEPLGAKRRWEKAQRKAAERRAAGLKEKPKMRILQENVLYLTIVNMPSQAEIEQARKDMKEEKERKRSGKTEKQQ